MSVHEPSGTSVCIHAVCVAEEHRRQGIALGLLREYVSRLERAAQEGAAYERILLITHEDMRSLYEKAGFEWLGRSKVVHGPAPWYEMRKVLVDPTPVQSIPPNIWEALQRATTSRAVPEARLLPSFARGIEEVSESAAGSSVATNKHDLLCPRQGCGSIILKDNVATLVERESVVLEPANMHNSPLPPMPTPPALQKWWRVTPNAMAFENIGFSKSIESHGMRFLSCIFSSALNSFIDGKRLKLLSCAECDLGPLGWCAEGGSEFWLASTRVGYRV